MCSRLMLVVCNDLDTDLLEDSRAHRTVLSSIKAAGSTGSLHAAVLEALSGLCMKTTGARAPWKAKAALLIAHKARS